MYAQTNSEQTPNIGPRSGRCSFLFDTLTSEAHPASDHAAIWAELDI
ncbi:MAG: hypothetical protein AABM66_10075 [Actinomycetota bacterium]